MRKRAHRVPDPISGILADWFGIEGGTARMLRVLYEAGRPVPVWALCHRSQTGSDNTQTYAARLRQAGLAIPRKRQGCYELPQAARLEVERALAHTARLLGQAVADLDEMETLREAVGLTYETPEGWGLTRQETEFVGILSRVKIATKERIMLALYPGRDDPPHIKIVDVLACRIRQKIRRHGADIVTVYGVGYSLVLNERQRSAA